MVKKRPLLDLQDILGSIIAAFFLIIGMNIPNIIQAVDGGHEEIIVAYQSNIEQVTDSLLGELSSRFLTPDIATFLLWAVIGVISYIFVSLIINSSLNLQETVEMTRSYIRPRYFGAKSFLRHYVLHTAAGIFGLVVFTGWIIIVLRYFTSFAKSTTYISLFDDGSIGSRLGYAVSGWMTMALSIVSTLVLVRIAKRAGEVAKNRV